MRQMGDNVAGEWGLSFGMKWDRDWDREWDASEPKPNRKWEAERETEALAK